MILYYLVLQNNLIEYKVYYKEPKELKWYVCDDLRFGGIVTLCKNGKRKKFNAIELVDVCLLAFFIAGLVALVLLVVIKKSKKFELPMVPFIFAGYVVRLCLV